MQTNYFSAQRAMKISALIMCAVALSGVTAVCQDMPSQKVGGTSTFDSPPGLSGNDGTSGRHRMSSLAVVPEDFSMLKLSPGFLLSMDVYDVPELSYDLRIDTNGDVTIPMIGQVHVADGTVTQAAAKIAQRLRDAKILNDPQVTLNIAQYAGLNITILGEVHNPGRMELLTAHNLADVLALAGGVTQFAGKTIEIRHQAGVKPQQQLIHYSRNTDDDTLSETSVLPGDTITVRRAGIVYVLGGVNRPGGYVMQEDGDLNVTQAISLAYGTVMQAAVSSMRLIRKLPDGRVQETPIPYKDIEKGKVAPPRLEPEDVIYVPISKTKTVLGAGLLATTAQAAIYIR
jgi:polysaccharide export outer membrane protein